MPKVRVRFAPSPTGFLHVGSLRTVLFNYLIAKKYDGIFFLRIEDTDQKREVAGSVEGLIDIIDWIGLKFDEGPHIGGNYGPYVQTERLDIYNKYLQELLEKGEAYHCFCTSERLEEMRADQQAKKLPPRYDRRCRDLSKEEVEAKIKNGESFVIRQKMPLSGDVIVYDELRGEIKFHAEDLDDHILIKSTGVPTYQFANVIDDHLMETSHVIRGEEWISSFPKNILLYQAFSWEAPKFIHMALTLNKEGGKLSKRQGDVAVEDYRAKGYLPEAMLNFSALLGWHPKDGQEILSLSEMIEKFEIKDMRTSGAVFDTEKLDYLNGYYIRQMSIDKLAEMCLVFLTKDGIIKEKINLDFIKKAVATVQERMKKLSEVSELTRFYFEEKLNYDPELLIWKKLTREEVMANLDEIYSELEKISEDNWTKQGIEKTIVDYLQNNNKKNGDYLWPMRVALTGLKASPSPFEVAEVLGKNKSLERIAEARKIL